MDRSIKRGVLSTQGLLLVFCAKYNILFCIRQQLICTLIDIMIYFNKN